MRTLLAIITLMMPITAWAADREYNELPWTFRVRRDPITDAVVATALGRANNYTFKDYQILFSCPDSPSGKTEILVGTQSFDATEVGRTLAAAVRVDRNDPIITTVKVERTPTQTSYQFPSIVFSRMFDAIGKMESILVVRIEDLGTIEFAPPRRPAAIAVFARACESRR